MITRYRKKLLLGLAGLAFAFLVGETAARVVLPLLPDPAGTSYIGDDACMYRLRPSAEGAFPEDHDEHINRYGFRDRNYAEAKTPGTYRVLGLGDSFVYGAVPIAENFLRLAEAELNGPGAPPTEILLLGVPGWSTENQAGVLADFGLSLAPDLVLVNFFVGNDVTGIPVRGRVIRGNLHPTTSPLPVRNFLRRSHLFLLFESQVLRKMRRGLVAAQEAAPSDAVSDLYLKIMPHNLPVYRKQVDGRTERLWAEAEGYLQAIDRMCRRAGVPWLLILIPGEVQVDPVVREQVLAGLDLAPADYDFAAPQRRLEAFAASRGIVTLDLLPVLRRHHAPDRRLYVPNDTHWNEAGNRIAAAAVAAAVARLRREP